MAIRETDMKEMIHREIQSIPGLEERTVFKALMEEVFLAVYETNEQMYTQLEERLQEELAFDVNRYLVRTGVVEREFFDASHHLMAPIEEADLKAGQYDMADIKAGLKEQGEFVLMKVLLCYDAMRVWKLWEKEPEFEGSLETATGKNCGIRVKLRRNTEYIRKVARLYQLFIKNGVPWQTVNCPYLYKMADVVLTGLPEETEENEAISRVSIHFGEHHAFVRHNLIPVWNIRKLSLDSVGFPVPCEDHINFEHIISVRNFGTGHAYLAEDNPKIQSIRQSQDRLLITSGIREAKRWDIYMICGGKDSKIDRYVYPVMENKRAENFAERFQQKGNQGIKTRAELERFIRGFGMEAYVRYLGCEVIPEWEQARETYSMNPFIEDEIRDTQDQSKLVLRFGAGENEVWLQQDIASFLVSEVQRLYPEYECGGIFV